MQSLYRPTRLKLSYNPSGEIVWYTTRKLRAYMRYKRIKHNTQQTA